MNTLISVASLAALAMAAPLSAQDTEKPEFPSPNAIVEQAAPEEWVAIAPSDLLVMDLAPDAEGPSTSSGPRRVIIQLMPEPFSQGWIRNIRKLAVAHWWDGTSVNRVQDNYVVQWGDAGYDNPETGETKQKALPDGLETVPGSEYTQQIISGDPADTIVWKSGHGVDNYSDMSLFHKGWPLAAIIGVDTRMRTHWPIHCYGAVGVGRGLSPDTGSGAELYTVIGHAPRHLDRNIAVVGRVIEGIEHLSSLPRGKGQLGFYEHASKRVPIRSIRLASELPAAERPRFEYLSTEGQTFAKYADARANRRDPFFIVPAGGADICNIPVPVRRVLAE